MNQNEYALWSDRCRESLLGFVSGEVEKEEITQLMMGNWIWKIVFPGSPFIMPNHTTTILLLIEFVQIVRMEGSIRMPTQ